MDSSAATASAAPEAASKALGCSSRNLGLLVGFLFRMSLFAQLDQCKNQTEELSFFSLLWELLLMAAIAFFVEYALLISHLATGKNDASTLSIRFFFLGALLGAAFSWIRMNFFSPGVWICQSMAWLILTMAAVRFPSYRILILGLLLGAMAMCATISEYILGPGRVAWCEAPVLSPSPLGALLATASIGIAGLLLNQVACRIPEVVLQLQDPDAVLSFVLGRLGVGSFLGYLTCWGATHGLLPGSSNGVSFGLLPWLFLLVVPVAVFCDEHQPTLTPAADQETDSGTVDQDPKDAQMTEPLLATVISVTTV